MKHICLKEGEVVKEGSVLLRLLDEQPPEGLKLCYISDEYVSFTKVGFTWRIKLRYPSGEYLVKETCLPKYWEINRRGRIINGVPLSQCPYLPLGIRWWLRQR